MNITSVVVLVMSLVMVQSSSVITVPSLVMMPIAILGIGYRGYAWDNYKAPATIPPIVMIVRKFFI
jgi:hypothetical protein